MGIKNTKLVYQKYISFHYCNGYSMMHQLSLKDFKIKLFYNNRENEYK